MPEFTFSENLFVCIVLVMAIGIGVLVVHGLMLALEIFSFLQDIGNYKDRFVARYPQEGDFLVDTVAVSDGQKPFETAVKHPDYHEGEIVIVETYPTKEAAQDGHDKWVKIMTADNLPESLADCANSEIASMIGTRTYPRRQ
jgi:hypothetical protein